MQSDKEKNVMFGKEKKAEDKKKKETALKREKTGKKAG